MTVTCTATFHQGDDVHQWTGVGHGYMDAFISAATDREHIGLVPNTANRESAVALLRLHITGAVPATDSAHRDGHVWIKLAPDLEPVIEIGWVTYTFTRSVRLWSIGATVTVQMRNSEWSAARQVPTFYLDPQVQGIVDSDHAVRIAEEILSTAGALDDPDVSYSISAVPVY